MLTGTGSVMLVYTCLFRNVSSVALWEGIDGGVGGRVGLKRRNGEVGACRKQRGEEGILS